LTPTHRKGGASPVSVAGDAASSAVERALNAARAELDRAGLNLQTLLRRNDAEALAPGLADLPARFPTLLLLGSAGPGLWAAIQAEGRSAAHPVDAHCLRALQAFADQLGAAGIASALAWHGAADRPLPVVRLGELAGWSNRSRMGLGIHNDHGLWFAYRGAVLLGLPFPSDAHLQRSDPQPPASPCLSCEAEPCVGACPVGAVGGPGGIDLGVCYNERERPSAPCGDRCLSRLACPVGVTSRYSLAQIAHHHAHARMPTGWRDVLPKPPPEWLE
jgi:hypothetical protein